MSKDFKTIHEAKTILHLRNLHRQPYDFKALSKTCPGLRTYVFENPYGIETIDFSNANAVRMLNKALLFHFYALTFWDIPENYLCPPVPGRADYLHYMADLLAQGCNGKIPMGASVSVLDVGIGANCIYPIIGASVYGWRFVGTDIDPEAIQSAEKIVKENSVLSDKISCRLQTDRNAIFKGILLPGDRFHFSICNPPFNDSLEAASTGNLRKWKNLGADKGKKVHLNFGGNTNELTCEGGEIGFLHRMIQESAMTPDVICWYSSLVSKSASLKAVYASLKKAGALEVKTIEMAQGHKKSRLVAWSFLDASAQADWY
jgi:23S rRNA (adenine1618-N6)-methyltransferase